ncbi:hypothetical protein AAHC03_04362 [Spirometra sp. Aus1]
MSGQLYAAALSNIFLTDKKICKTFDAIFQKLSPWCLADCHQLQNVCQNIALSSAKKEFSQADHVALIGALMQASVAKIAPAPAIEAEIRNLLQDHEDGAYHNLISQSDDVCVGLSALIGRQTVLVLNWLKAVALAVLPNVLGREKVSRSDLLMLIDRIGFISLLSCAVNFYASRLPSLTKEERSKLADTVPQLNALLADCGGHEPISHKADRKTPSTSEDDQANANNLLTLLGAFAGTAKGNKTTEDGTKPASKEESAEQGVRRCLLTAALCALPRLTGVKASQDSLRLPGLCVGATFFHWLVNNTPNELLSPVHDALDSPPVKQPRSEAPAQPSTTASTPNTARSNVLLKNLVRTSGGPARRARPANPESLPIAVVDLATVEQLVSSTSGLNEIPSLLSTNQHRISSSDEPDRDPTSGLLKELACTAALAAVADTDTADRVEVPIPTSPASSMSTLPGEAQSGFYLKKESQDAALNGVCTDDQSGGFHRSKLYATYKVTSTNRSPDQTLLPPAQGSYHAADCLPHKASPDVTSPTQEVVSTTQSPLSPVASAMPLAGNNQQPQSPTTHRMQWSHAPSRPEKTLNDKMTWRDRDARHRSSTHLNTRDLEPGQPQPANCNAVSVSRASSTSQLSWRQMEGPPSSSRSQTAVLRLSLDQRRRAIEASRQRALQVGDKSAADRHQAAFLALLHSTQRRRRNLLDEASLAEDEEDCTIASQRANYAQDHSRENLVELDRPQAKVEPEPAEEQEAKVIEDTREEVGEDFGQNTDMEDFSSMYLPADAEHRSIDRNNSQFSEEHEIVVVDSDNRNGGQVEDSPVLSAGDCDFSIVVSHEDAHERRQPKRCDSPQNFKVSRTREYHTVSRTSARRTQPSPRPSSPHSSTPDTPVSESGSSSSPSRHCHCRHGDRSLHGRTKRSVSGSRSTLGPCGPNCSSGLTRGAESCNHGAASMYESLPRTRRRTPCASDQRSCCRPSDYSQAECECCSEHAATLPGSYANLPPQISGRTPHLRHGGSLKIFRNVRMSHDLAREREVIDELSPDVYWNDSPGKHGARRSSSRRRLQLTALDSGEEQVYAPYSRRPRDMRENRLGYSTGTGLDQLAIEELARSVTNLKSDIERLTLQQQSLMDSTAARNTDSPTVDDDVNVQDAVGSRPRPPRSLHSAHSVGRLHHSPNTTPMTPSTSRATWNTRTPLRYPSQADMQSTNLDKPNGETVPSGVDTTCNIQSPGQSDSPSPSVLDLSNPVVQNGARAATTSLLAAEKFTEARDAASNSSDSKETTPIPENQRAPEQLFIAFEDPQSERLRRARERIEARIAAERRQNTEKTLRARHAKLEAQVLGELTHHQELDLRREEEKSPDPSSNPTEPLFPVHTTTFDSKPTAPATETSRPPSAAGAKKPALGSNRNAAANTTHASRWSSSAQRGKAACSVSSSQAAPAAGSRVTSSNGSRRLPNGGASGSGETEGSELETEDTERKFCTTPRHRSSSRQSVGKLSAGRSLSSLHRLTSGEDSAYSGPGLPVAGLPQTRLYAKPKPKSNRAVIVNAISHCCLAGTVNESIKKTTLQELAAVDGSHFIVLFRDSRCQYRALYAFDPESEELHLISGNGPRKIIHKMVDKFFKYNSGLKQFTEITSTKHLSTVVDAITIQNNFWARNSSIASTTATARGSLTQSVNGGHS